MEVIGIRNCSFKAKSGDDVQGLKLYLLDGEKRVDDGIACKDLFVSDAAFQKSGLRSADIQVGDHLDIFYNEFGRIKSITVQ